jgi:hypothetical protein
MITRIVRTELLRGTAPLALLATAIGMAWTLAVHPEDWSGRWTLLAAYLRGALLILCPVMVAAGAWQAGRERRQRIGELLAATARPAWQPLLVAWIVVTLAGTAGVLVPLAVVAVLVGRVATYAGGGWWWTALVGLLALWPATALGLLAGRLIPLRVVAPLAGLFTYVGLGITMYLRPAPHTPVRRPGGEANAWPWHWHAWQAGWLLAIALLFLLLAMRRRLAATVPAVAVLVLAGLAPPARSDVDPGAAALTCTTTGPQVCVSRVNAFLLADVARFAQPLLAKMAGVPGAPVRALDNEVRTGDRTDTVWLSLTYAATVGGSLRSVDVLRSDFGQVAFAAGCPSAGSADDDRAFQARLLADAWLTGHGSADRLATLPPERQRAWFAAFLAAQRRCDTATLRALADPE